MLQCFADVFDFGVSPMTEMDSAPSAEGADRRGLGLRLFSSRLPLIAAYFPLTNRKISDRIKNLTGNTLHYE
jgi:hypothetical protein